MVVATKKKPAGKPAGKAPAKKPAKAAAKAKPTKAPPKKAAKPKPTPTPESVEQAPAPQQAAPAGWGAALQPAPEPVENDSYTPPAFLGLQPAEQDAPQPEPAPAPAPRAAPPIGHNAINKELVAFVERLERLADEKAGIVDDMKEVVAEAKGRGFDAAILRKVLSRRRMDADKRITQDELLDTYERALGMN